MSSRRTNNKSAGTYNYASKGQRGIVQRSRFDLQGDRDRRSKVIDNLRLKFSDLPMDAFVSDTHGSLIKVMVPYDSVDPRASLWRGAVVDYEKTIIVKYGARVALMEVPDDFDVTTMTEVSEGNAFIEPFLGGALVSVFKYNGTIYYSTGRSLGVNASRHPGAANIKEELIAVLPEGLIESLFDDEVRTYHMAHDFILLTKDTLDVTRAPVALPSVIYNGISCLTSQAGGSLRTTEVTPPLALGEETLYPTEPGFYSSAKDISFEVAQDWLSGKITGSPEEIFVSRESTCGDESPIRIQPYSANVRHLIRGNVASLPVRLTQLLADYTYEVESGELLPIDKKEKIIYLSPNVLVEEAIKEEMMKSLPLSRFGEIDTAFGKMGELKKKLIAFYRSKGNVNHPASTYHSKYHAYRPHELEVAIWNMTQEDLFSSLRWYKLI